MNKPEKRAEFGEPQVDPEHYGNFTYNSKTRFISYWHQINQVAQTQPSSVLEIGVGSGFVNRYLREMGINIHTLDFDARLNPDTVGSVLELPFADDEFDVVCCFETLEHLPWEHFDTAVSELARVARRVVLISLPDRTPCVRLEAQWHSVTAMTQQLVDLPNPRPQEHVFDGEHYWEIGRKGYPLGRIIKYIERHGLRVEEKFRVFENPFHRFLRCSVR